MEATRIPTRRAAEKADVAGVRQQSRSRAVPAILPADAGGFLRAVVAADTPATSDHLADLLRSWGHDVWVADTGPEALELAHAMRPAVCLLDAQLQVMDGYEVAAHVRQDEALKGATLIGMTDMEEPGSGLGRIEGFDFRLAKPIDPGLLRRTIRVVHETMVLYTRLQQAQAANAVLQAKTARLTLELRLAVGNAGSIAAARPADCGRAPSTDGIHAAADALARRVLLMWHAVTSRGVLQAE
jgi:CheY-like chemotaxis protein